MMRVALAIAADRIYAHNWIDYKDARYCEGCDLAAAARQLAYVPGRTNPDAPATLEVR
jgi:hypothetical protein